MSEDGSCAIEATLLRVVISLRSFVSLSAIPSRLFCCFRFWDVCSARGVRGSSYVPVVRPVVRPERRQRPFPLVVRKGLIGCF